ncbi:hypothetical protein R1sor_020673 [Riccia sorocarpa]|uniref:Uncharacterized protein n=1 Tax=Riccia sorocarpa TaxID=122646 RepID=A0ABD3GEU6_9MARC
MAVKPIREHAGLKICHDLWYYIMSSYSKRREALVRIDGPLTPFAKVRFEENELALGRLSCFVSGSLQASVKYQDGKNCVIIFRTGSHFLGISRDTNGISLDIR